MLGRRFLFTLCFLFALHISRVLLGESIVCRGLWMRQRACSGYQVCFFEYMGAVAQLRSLGHMPHGAGTDSNHEFDLGHMCRRLCRFGNPYYTHLPVSPINMLCFPVASGAQFLPHQHVLYFEVIAITTKIMVPESEKH